ncbi:MAG: CoA transferase [Dehalococcoidia bacterium]|nr:CoA transferase [Dehalococcoidia bacterium]
MTPSRRALDVSMDVASAYATRLLADLGWDVVKVEPEGGDVMRERLSRWGDARGAAFEAVNTGKRSVTLDGDALQALVATADVVVGDFRPVALARMGVAESAFTEWQPRHAVVSVTPFGLTGPKHDWVATEVTVQAASGLMFLTGEWDQQPQQLAPYQAEMTGGVAAAAASLAALRSATAAAPARIDLSLYETMVMHTFQAIGPYAYNGEVARREQRVKAGLRMVPTSDGYVYCAPGAVASMRMDGIAELVGEPRLAEERFQTAEGRMQHWDEFLELFVPPFRTRTAQEWFEAAEAMHMTFALVQTLDDLFSCPQLASREFLHEVPSGGGAPITTALLPYTTTAPSPTARPAPASPGIDTASVLRDWLGR